MAAPVDKLMANQLAVLLGVGIAPTSTPTMAISQAGAGLYNFILNFQFAADVEYDPAHPTAKLPSGSDYAILNFHTDGSSDPIPSSTMEVSYKAIKIGTSDFVLKLEINARIPGSKGNHGS